MPRGGKREGAGRKPAPSDEKCIKRLISFDPEVWRWMEESLEKGDRSRFLNDLVREKMEES